MRFLAFPPILDRKGELFPYELLYRSGEKNSFDGNDPEKASLAMFDTSFLIGLQRVTGRERAFVNCPREFLLNDSVSMASVRQLLIKAVKLAVAQMQIHFPAVNRLLPSPTRAKVFEVVTSPFLINPPAGLFRSS